MMRQRELVRQSRISMVKESSRVKVPVTSVSSDLPIYALLSIVQEAINSHYPNDELWKHVDDFGLSLNKDVADVARMALRGFLIASHHE